MIAFLALSAFAALSGTPAAKGYYALSDQIDHSVLVCIGTVEDIVLVLDPETGERRLPVARVAVERVLKGAADTRTVHHEAWGTWACDTTGARIGQRALFLLGPHTQLSRFTEEERRAVHADLGTELVLRNVGSGDGIRTIDVSRGEERVACRGAPDVIAPPSEMQRLVDIARYVEELARFSPDAASAHARSGRASSRSREPSGSFDLRILPDGSARLARSLGRSERVVTWELEPAERERLARELGLATAGEVRAVGSAPGHDDARRLTVRSGAASLSFVEPRDRWSPPIAGTTEERFAAADALRAWQTIRATIACDGCDDHSEKDRRWLAALR
jgi:hypothetical protein